MSNAYARDLGLLDTTILVEFVLCLAPRQNRSPRWFSKGCGRLLLSSALPQVMGVLRGRDRYIGNGLCLSRPCVVVATRWNTLTFEIISKMNDDPPHILLVGNAVNSMSFMVQCGTASENTRQIRRREQIGRYPTPTTAPQRRPIALTTTTTPQH
jgi:hypothetical protein